MQWVVPYWTVLDSPRRNSSALWAFRPSPEQDPPSRYARKVSVMTWCSRFPDACRLDRFCLNASSFPSLSLFRRARVNFNVFLGRFRRSGSCRTGIFWAFIVEDLKDPLTMSSIYCVSLFLERGSQLADYSWAYFEKTFLILARFLRARFLPFRLLLPRVKATQGYLSAYLCGWVSKV
jgi:hypothetical protein